MSGLHVLTNVGGETRLANIDLKTYEKGFEEILSPELIYQEYGDRRSLKRNGGTSVEYTRLERLIPASTPVPLTEGSAGSPRTSTTTIIPGTPEQYGEYIKLSDRLVKQGKAEYFKEQYTRLAQLGGETFDIVHMNGIIEGSNVVYAGSKAGTDELDNDCKATLALFRKAKKYLDALHNKGFENGLYIAMCHTDTINELIADPEWMEKTKFQDPSKFSKGEVGTVDGIKYVKSSQAYVKPGAGATTNIGNVASTGSAANVYCSFLIGSRKAYGVIGLEGEDTPKTIFKDLGSAGANDPMDQIATLAYVGFTSSKIINDNMMYRVEHTCSL